MKIDFRQAARKLLYNKKFTMVFSLLVAIVIWMTVVIGQTPNIEQTLTNVSVTISTEDTVVSQLGLDETTGAFERTVSVKLSGPAYVISNITAEDLSVSASLANVTAPGKYELELSATKKRMSGEYTIKSITPATITASFDYIDTKQFTVVPKITGVSAVNGLVAEDPIVSDFDGVITVKGSRTQLQKIATAEARYTANEVLSATKTYDAELVFLDDVGNALDASQFNISTKSVKVSVPISKMKTVAVAATFINAPGASGHSPVSYKLSNSSIAVIGPPATIDALTKIELAPVDFNSITVNKSSFDVAPVLPDGVKTVDNIDAVTVKLNLSGYTVKTFTVNNIAALNNNTGGNITLNNSIKNVKICGPASVIKKIKASDLIATVDLAGKSAGSYTMAVSIKCNNYQNVWQVGKYQATVTVK